MQSILNSKLYNYIHEISCTDLNMIDKTSYCLTGGGVANKPSGTGDRCLVVTFIPGRNTSYALQICGDYNGQGLYYRIGLSRAWIKLAK